MAPKTGVTWATESSRSNTGGTALSRSSGDFFGAGVPETSLPSGTGPSLDVSANSGLAYANPTSPLPLQAGKLHPPIRLLSVIGGLDPRAGGPSEVLINACVATQRAGIKNTLLFPLAAHAVVDVEPIRSRLIEEGVKVQTFRLLPPGRGRIDRWGISPHMVRWLSSHVTQYDIVHLHSSWGLSQVSALLAARRSSRPCVMSPHETFTAFDVERPGRMLRRPAKRALKRLYLRHLSLLVFSSELEARDSHPVSEAGETAVIRHPLQGALEAPRAASVPHSGPLRIGFLGRLHPKKNVDVLIRAVRAASHDARLLIAGDGPPQYREELQGLAAGLEMGDRIEWLGFIPGERRWPFIDSLDVLAMPSRYECFGMVAAEAMGRGIATVVSRDTGIAEVADQYNCGMVSAPTVDDFARAFRTLDQQRELLTELATRASTAAHQHLSTQAYGDAIRKQYQRLLDHHGGAHQRSEDQGDSSGTDDDNH